MIEASGEYKTVVEETYQKWKSMEEASKEEITREDIEEFVELCTDEGVMVLEEYESAFMGVTTEGLAVYEYSKMIEYLLDKEMTLEEAKNHLESNTIRACRYMGEKAPIILWGYGEN